MRLLGTFPSLKCDACGETDRFRIGIRPWPRGLPAAEATAVLYVDCQACECRHPFFLALPLEYYADPSHVDYMRPEGPPMPV